jgi:hypothetical protein
LSGSKSSAFCASGGFDAPRRLRAGKEKAGPG